MCVRACVRACVRVCVRARACVCGYVYVCVWTLLCVLTTPYIYTCSPLNTVGWFPFLTPVASDVHRQQLNYQPLQWWRHVWSAVVASPPPLTKRLCAHNPVCVVRVCHGDVQTWERSTTTQSVCEHDAVDMHGIAREVKSDWNHTLRFTECLKIRVMTVILVMVEQQGNIHKVSFFFLFLLKKQQTKKQHREHLKYVRVCKRTTGQIRLCKGLCLCQIYIVEIQYDTCTYTKSTVECNK